MAAKRWATAEACGSQPTARGYPTVLMTAVKQYEFLELYRAWQS